MPQLNPHRPLTLTGQRWLVHLADPAQRVAAPAGFPDVREVDALLAAAERHGVLPAVTRALAARLEEHGERRPRGADTVSAALGAARRKVVNQTGFGLLLSHHAGNVIQALSGAAIAAAVVKGASFARRLYPDAALRTFTDVDVLLPEAQREGAARVMRNLGFEQLEIEDRRGKDYQEQKWVLPMHRDVMIELHSNLVHSPKLRGAMSIRYEDVLAAGEGDSNAPTALLLVGAAHAAVGHQCDRLQQLVDIVQAVRGTAGVVDQKRLACVARRCGVALAVAAAIDLGGRTINEPVATELARRVLPGRLGRLPGRILTPGLVLRAQSGTRARGSWRRKIFRQVLGAGVA